MPWLKLLKVIFQDVEAELAAAREQFPRFDDGINGLVWLLERNARPVESFPTSTAENEFMFGFEGDRENGIPDMWVVYSFDDETVTILAINAMPAGSENNNS